VPGSVSGSVGSLAAASQGKATQSRVSHSQLSGETFGRSTMQWWALIGTELIAAPSAEELSRLLTQAVNLAPPVA
jgi:hypothetical protein